MSLRQTKVSERSGLLSMVFFFKQKTAYELRISDWSSDVCASDLASKCRELVEHHQQLVFAAGCPGTVELLGEPAPDLIEDQPHQRFGSADVRWRDHAIERGWLSRLDEIGDATIAARSDLGDGRVKIQTEARHRRGPHDCAPIVGDRESVRLD